MIETLPSTPAAAEHYVRTTRERSPWPGLAALMLIAAVLRLIALDQQLWYDEMLTLVRSVRLPLGQILTTYTSQNEHLLYSVLARISFNIFGEHIWSLRLPAVLFGVAAVPALYFCARLWTTSREAWLACALLTASYHHVWFSQNARGYTGMAFWTLLTTYLFVRALREQCVRLWLWYGLAMALGLYTHLTIVFVTVGQFLAYLWILASPKLPQALGIGAQRTEATAIVQRPWRPFWGFIAAGILTVLFYAPILPRVLDKTVGKSAQASVASEWTNPLWLVLEALKGLAAGAGGAAGFVVLPVAGIILLAGVLSYWRQDRIAVALMVVPGVLTGGVMLMLEHNLWPRFFFFAIGFGFLLLMRGAIRTGEWAAAVAGRGSSGLAWGTALALLMIAGSAWSVRSAWIYPKQDFVGAMQLVDAERREGEPVLLGGLGVFPYTRYFQRDWQPVATRAEVDAARAAGKRVWLLTTFPIYLKSRHPDVWETLERDFTLVKVFRGTIGDGEVRVYRWTPPPASAAQQQ